MDRDRAEARLNARRTVTHRCSVSGAFVGFFLSRYLAAYQLGQGNRVAQGADEGQGRYRAACV
jgi:hypothetical protein